MDDITQLLKAASQGDRAASDRVVAALYDDLRRQARRHLRQSGNMTLLDTTALVHEVWLRLSDLQGQGYPDRRHYLAYAGRAMRSVVVDLVRARQAERRGGGQALLTLDTAVAEQTPQPYDDVLQVHEALGVTERTVQRDWQKARLFLAASLRN